MLKIGQPPYLNCEPFFARMTGVELVALDPRRLGQAVAAGELAGGPLSLVDGLRLDAVLDPLPFGIATDRPPPSVFVFSPRPLPPLGAPAPRRTPPSLRRRGSCSGCSRPGSRRSPRGRGWAPTLRATPCS